MGEKYAGFEYDQRDSGRVQQRRPRFSAWPAEVGMRLLFRNLNIFQFICEKPKTRNDSEVHRKKFPWFNNIYDY